MTSHARCVDLTISALPAYHVVGEGRVPSSRTLLSGTMWRGDVVSFGSARCLTRAPATGTARRETNSQACSRLHAALPIHYRPCHLVSAATACWRLCRRPYHSHWQGASLSARLSHHRQSPVVSDNPPPRVLASGCRCGATAELATQYLHQNTASLDLPIAYTLVLSRCLEPLKPPKPVRQLPLSGTQRLFVSNTLPLWGIHQAPPAAIRDGHQTAATSPVRCGHLRRYDCRWTRDWHAGHGV